MRDAILLALASFVLAWAVLDYVEATEERLARLERRPAVIIGGKWRTGDE
jgi:hypothetical protein